jgi:uncharacterized membrane protein YeaQ/YmgE (transglycosylase-associated protein family)
MEILWFIIVGFIAGLIARAIMPGNDPMGWIMTTLLGIAGALIAGFLGRAVGWYEPGATGPGLIAAIIGAVILLALGRVLMKGSRRGTPRV